jgi:DNA mismatch repair protein MutS
VQGASSDRDEGEVEPHGAVSAADASAIATPMMAQYIEIKAANPDSLLFYRMGDFYELFFEDAVKASQALGITLTKRGKHQGADIAMCGVPIHAADAYLQKLIKRGFRVAVCEQTEDPAEAKKRGAKSVVRRDVVRLVTPGTLTEDSLLEPSRPNFLTALFEPGTEKSGEAPRIGLSSLDMSTGELVIGAVLAADLSGELGRLLPSEMLVVDTLAREPRIVALAKLIGASITPVPKAYFDSAAGERGLKERLGLADLAGYGTFSRAELAAAAALLKYVELTQIGRPPLLRPPRRSGADAVMVIDAATRSNLEVLRNSSGGRDGSLLEAMDRTVTGAGGRELALRLSSPLRDAVEINARLDAVGFLVTARALRQELRVALKATPDMARALGRLAYGRGGPRDLAAIRDGLAGVGVAQAVLRHGAGDLGLPRPLQDLAGRLTVDNAKLQSDLTGALADDLPVNRRDGGFVRAGHRTDLDDNRRLRDESHAVLAELQGRYVADTQVKSLKVKHNNVLGYFVEVPAAQSKPLETATGFTHRQTLANVMRFATPELSEVEGRITAAADRALAIEQEVFTGLAAAIAAEQGPIGNAAMALAELDHAQGLAELADDQAYVRPMLDDGLAFDIRGGRHPVVEQALKSERGQPFIENDCILGLGKPKPSGDGKLTRPAKSTAPGQKSAMPNGALPLPPDTPETGFDETRDHRLWIVTGPNMAGKSTFLRQNALIAILAQIGSFVPARSAHIGVVDRLFSRVGASDDLARGRSTFMVEMVETAGILNQATDRSLVILDEIGRGTATFDGLSIAWACLEYLNSINRCRALFATHFHELTALAGSLSGVANATMQVKEWQDGIIFLHRVVPGAADRSYGIQVAKLAGLPKPVIDRAGEVLRLLEDSDQRKDAKDMLADLPLFAAVRPKSSAGSAPSGPSPVEVALAEIVPDDLSPRQALEALFKLKGLLAGR